MTETKDFEDRLRELLTESVDTRLGPRRPAPPFRPAAHGARRPAWALPLAAAAAVVIVSGGALALSRLGDHDSARPVTHHRTPPAYHLESVGGASIAVPTGWRMVEQGDVRAGSRAWCLAPGGRAPSLASDCPVSLRLYSPGAGNEPAIDVDNEGGAYGDPPQYCLGRSPEKTVDRGVRAFGGRSAEYRFFHITCPGSPKRFDIEQYVVPTDPAAALVSQLHATAATERAMRVIAQHSTLPAQDRPLRLYDHGAVGSTRNVAAGVEVKLANGRTYVLSRHLLAGQTVAAGRAITIFTNGTTVIQFY